jgi:uncharacterized membrane protein
MKEVVIKIIKVLRQSIITGTLVLIPAVTSIFILYKLFIWLDSVLPTALNLDLPAGTGILAILIITFVTGILARHYLGKQIINMVTNFIAHIPVVSKVYMTVQQIVDLISQPKMKAFSKVVLIEYPRKGVWVLGFVTSYETPEISETVGEKMVCVYVPTAPNPISGFTMYLPQSEIRDVNISPEIAVKAIVSMGMVSSAKANGKNESKKMPTFSEWLKSKLTKKDKKNDKILWP